MSGSKGLLWTASQEVYEISASSLLLMGAKTVFEVPWERRGIGFAHSSLLRRKSSSVYGVFWEFILANIGDRCFDSWFVHRSLHLDHMHSESTY